MDGSINQVDCLFDKFQSSQKQTISLWTLEQMEAKKNKKLEHINTYQKNSENEGSTFSNREENH